MTNAPVLFEKQIVEIYVCRDIGDHSGLMKEGILVGQFGDDWVVRGMGESSVSVKDEKED